MKEWLRSAMQHGEINQPQLARRMSERLGRSLDKSTIHKILKGKRNLKADEILVISAITGYPMPDESKLELSLALVAKASYVGIAATNYWFNKKMFHKAETQPDIPCIPGQYSDLDQTAYLIHGSTMEADRIYEGCFVICVDYWQARAKLLSGDAVIIERARGEEIEISCRKLLKSSTGFEVWTRSGNAKEDQVLHISEDGTGADKEGIVTRVIALVIGVYWPR